MIEDFHLSTVTKVPLKKQNFSLNTNSKTYFIGSCFSENLYSKFSKLYLNSEIAPFGNVYNPLSLANCLEIILENKKITKEELIQIDGLYQNYNFSTKSGDKSRENYLKNVNRDIDASFKFILDSDLLIITLGTAWVYEKGKKVVNNCLKLPKSDFKRRLLTLEEITEPLIKQLEKLKSINKKINIVLTLSPVRHLRDCPTDNSLSKALLRVGIDTIVKKVDAVYYPSYEIVLDELRDYRWYNKDLAHPNSIAVEYVTDRFIDSATTEQLNAYLKRVKKLNSMLNHRLINIDSDSSKKFIQKRETSLLQLKKDYPELIKLLNIR